MPLLDGAFRLCNLLPPTSTLHISLTARVKDLIAFHIADIKCPIPDTSLAKRETITNDQIPVPMDVQHCNRLAADIEFQTPVSADPFPYG
jgi:hypothetical protein